MTRSRIIGEGEGQWEKVLHGRFAAFMLAAWLGATCAAQAAQPSSGPGNSYPLYHELYQQARDALTGGGNVKTVVAAIDGELKSVVASDAKDQCQRLSELLCMRGTLTKFADAKNPDMAACILDRPQVCGRLLHAMDDHNKPVNVLKVLKELKDFNPQRFEKYPEFAIAFSVVWDDYHPYHWVEKQNGPVKPGQMISLYKYFADNEAQMMYDPWTLPVELAVFVVGSPVTAAERDWALKKYPNPLKADKIYFSVPWSQKLSPAHGFGTSLDYTLPNIQSVGGVCMEQAYVTEQVMRLRGVPAVYLYGEGHSGYHAWVGVFLMAPGPHWDLTIGRYKYNHYYRGSALGRDSDIPEADILMTAAAFGGTSLAKFEQGNFLRDACLWVAKAMPPGGEANVPPRTDLVLKLANSSLTANPYNAGMWKFLAEMAKKKELNPKQAMALARRLADTTLGGFPDFTVDGIGAYLACVGDNDLAIQVYDNLYNSLAKGRADLASNVKVAEGAVWLDKGDVRNAIQCYVYPMVNFSKDEFVLDQAKAQLEKIDEKADEAKVEQACLEIIKVLSANRNPTGEQVAAADIILKKLVSIYEKRGDTQKADKYRGAISKGATSKSAT